MTQEDLIKYLQAKPGYIKSGAPALARRFDIDEDEARNAVKKAQTIEIPLLADKLPEGMLKKETDLFEEFLKWKESRVAPPVPEIRVLPTPYEGGDEGNVLIIGDIHEPFSLEGYLEFCRTQQEIFNCGKVVFIGDIIDNHFASYHETDTTAYGADEELDLTIAKIQEWYYVFPEATVLVGNHDRLTYRKARTGGVSSKWVKGYGEVLGTPGWDFVDEFICDDVCYNHGEGGTARKKMRDEAMSQVQGHLHSQAYIEFSVGENHRMFAMQVGAGIDKKSYAFAYGKTFKKPVISCGVVLQGQVPIVLPMPI